MKRAMSATNGMIPRNITYNAVIMSRRAVQSHVQRNREEKEQLQICDTLTGSASVSYHCLVSTLILLQSFTHFIYMY
jgi:hypothetical protein